MEPKNFEAKRTSDELERFGHAILFGYKNMDRMLGEFMRLEEDGATLVLSTALSQQPFLKHEGVGGQHFYRPRDIHVLLNTLNVKPRAVQPVMTHQYQLRFNSREEQIHASGQLQKVFYLGQPAFAVEIKDDSSLYIGCQIRHRVDDDAEIILGYDGRTAKFKDYLYIIDAVKSGCHHPDGVLWFKTGEHLVHKERVSILDIMPTLLELLGINYAATKAHPFTGKSLVPYWERDRGSVAEDIDCAASGAWKPPATPDAGARRGRAPGIHSFRIS